MRIDEIVRGVGDAISKHEASVEERLSQVRREVRNDVVRLLDRDFASDLVKDYRPGKVYGVGAIVRADGGVWQAWAETDAHPLEKESGWVCLQAGINGVEMKATERERTLVIRTSDGQSTEFVWRDPVPMHHGKWDQAISYEKGDMVAWDGGSWICQAEETSAEPGQSRDWSLVAQRGKPGKEGQQGPQGPAGPRGEPGRDADPVVAARMAVKEIRSDEEFLAAIVEQIEKGVNDGAVVEGAGQVMRYRGEYQKNERYAAGDVVTIRALGLFQARRPTVADPRGVGIEDWNPVFVAAGGAASGGTPLVQPIVADNLVVTSIGQTSFTLSQVPVFPNTVELHVNGQALHPGDISVAGAALTYANSAFELEPGDEVWATYM